MNQPKVKIFLSYRFDESTGQIGEIKEKVGDGNYEFIDLGNGAARFDSPLVESIAGIRRADAVVVIVGTSRSDDKHLKDGKELTICEHEVEEAITLGLPILAYCDKLILETHESDRTAVIQKQFELYERLKEYCVVAEFNAKVVCNDLFDPQKVASFKAVRYVTLETRRTKNSINKFAANTEWQKNVYTHREPVSSRTVEKYLKLSDVNDESVGIGLRLNFVVAPSGVGKTTYIDFLCRARLEAREKLIQNPQEKGGTIEKWLKYVTIRLDGASADTDESMVGDPVGRLRQIADFSPDVQDECLSKENWEKIAIWLVIDGFNQWDSKIRLKILNSLRALKEKVSDRKTAINIIITTRPNTFKSIAEEVKHILDVDCYDRQFDLPSLLFSEISDDELQRISQRRAYSKYAESPSFNLPPFEAVNGAVRRQLLCRPVLFSVLALRQLATAGEPQQLPNGISGVQDRIRRFAAQNVVNGLQVHRDWTHLASEFLLCLARNLLIENKQGVTKMEAEEIGNRCFANLANRPDGLAREIVEAAIASDVLDPANNGQREGDSAVFRFRYDVVLEAFVSSSVDLACRAIATSSNSLPATAPEYFQLLFSAIKHQTANSTTPGDSQDRYLTQVSTLDEVHTQGFVLGLSIFLSDTRDSSQAYVARLFDTCKVSRFDATMDYEYAAAATVFSRAAVSVFEFDAVNHSRILGVIDRLAEARNPIDQAWAILMSVECLQRVSVTWGEEVPQEQEGSTDRLIRVIRQGLSSKYKSVSVQACLGIVGLFRIKAFRADAKKCVIDFLKECHGDRAWTLLAEVAITILPVFGGSDKSPRLHTALVRLSLLLHEHAFLGDIDVDIIGLFKEQMPLLVGSWQLRVQKLKILEAIVLWSAKRVPSLLLRANKMPINFEQWCEICAKEGEGQTFIDSCTLVDPLRPLPTAAEIIQLFARSSVNAYYVQNLSVSLSGRFVNPSADFGPKDCMELVKNLIEGAQGLDKQYPNGATQLRYAISLALYHVNCFFPKVATNESLEAMKTLAAVMTGGENRGLTFISSSGERKTTNIIGTTVRSLMRSTSLYPSAFDHIDQVLMKEMRNKEMAWDDRALETADSILADTALMAILESGDRRCVGKLFSYSLDLWKRSNALSSNNPLATTKLRDSIADAFARLSSIYPRVVDDCLADRNGESLDNTIKDERDLVRHIQKSRLKSLTRKDSGFDGDFSSWIFERLQLNIVAGLRGHSKRLTVTEIVEEFCTYLKKDSKIPRDALSRLTLIVGENLFKVYGLPESQPE
jgi:hypothetical protein